MRADPAHDAPPAAPDGAAWRAMVAEDLSLLARLHGAELDFETLSALEAAGFPECLALPAGTQEGKEAHFLMKRVVEGDDAALKAPLDDLAADYAAIYLNGRYHASPNESAWLDEDGLERQAPMFAVRAWYREYGLEAGDWRRRQDDNLSLQLQFLAHLFNHAADDAALRPAARFLDEHPLLWIERFAQRVASRAATPFYAALAMLSADYLRTLRGALRVLADVPYPPPPEPKKPTPLPGSSCGPSSDVAPYVPGMEPSW